MGNLRVRFSTAVEKDMVNAVMRLEDIFTTIFLPESRDAEIEADPALEGYSIVIEYYAPGIIPELDKAIRELLVDYYEFEEVGTGYFFPTQMRDMEFTRKM